MLAELLDNIAEHTVTRNRVDFDKSGFRQFFCVGTVIMAQTTGLGDDNVASVNV